MVEQPEIHRKSKSKKVEERKEAAEQLGRYFAILEDKEQAWDDLIKLTQDKDNYVRWDAGNALGAAYSHIPEEYKQEAWEDLHKLTQDKDDNLRWRAAAALDAAYSYIPDKYKQEAWEDLHKLTQDKDDGVQFRAVDALGAVYFHVPHKQQAWEDLHKLAHGKNNNVRGGAASALGVAFSTIPEEHSDEAWEDLHKLAHDKDDSVRWGAVDALGEAYSHIPEKHKHQAWEDLHKLAQDKDNNVRGGTARALGSAYSHIPDEHKLEGWDDLIKLTLDKDDYVRSRAARALGSAYSYIPDEHKLEGWDDLIKLTQDKNDSVRLGAAYALGAAYSAIPEEHRQTAWEDLIKLTQDKYDNVRSGAANSLGVAFSAIPEEHRDEAWEDLIKLAQDKDDNVRWHAAYAFGAVYSTIPKKHRDEAWDDLHKLTQDKDDNVRGGAAYALGAAYSAIPEEHRDEAWDDLHKLTQDKDDNVRGGTASALGAAFSAIPEKHRDEAWDDLHKLTQDKDDSVRWGAVDALGAAFSAILEKHKDEAWDDMIRLASDTHSFVRMYANHSLGRASIFKATETKSDKEFGKELEKAIRFFEKASKESFYNPANFCLPFYRSFYAIISKSQQTQVDVDRYLAEAKRTVEGSESKEKLLAAVLNLSNALKEAHKARTLGEKQCDLNIARKYLERAAESLKSIGDKAPLAKRAVEMGLPIIDERIKGIIGEIQEKVRELCKKTKGTPLELLGLETNEKAKRLSELRDISLEFGMDRLTSSAFKFCEYIPSEKKPDACRKIASAKNMETPETGKIIAEVFEYILDNMDIPRIKGIHISEERNNTVKIATVQLQFKLTDSFPPKIINAEKVKMKVLYALKRAKEEGVNIVCLPELCVYEDWIPEIKRQFTGMMIIPGSHYDKENHNICKLILGNDIDAPPQIKFNPSAFEDSAIMGSRMVPGDKSVNIYETMYGKLAILICRDFGNFIHYLRGKVDVVFVPSYNDAIERFYKDADTYATNSPSYVIISNTAQFGGTSIFGQLNRVYFKILEQNGCKVKGDKSYKLCEIKAKKEGIIIADFNLSYKSPQLQTAIDPNEEIKPVTNIKKIDL